MEKGNQMVAIIEAYKIELYAKNTGEFYEQHKHLASRSPYAWMQHIRATILPRYCQEIEPVEASPQTVEEAAYSLSRYYVQHMAETDAVNRLS